MKKTMKQTLGAVVAGTTLLAVTVTAMGAQGNAYENYKEALKNTVEMAGKNRAGNGTLELEASLKRNGVQEFSMSTIQKMDGKNHRGTLQVEALGTQKEMEMSCSEVGNYLKVGDNYYSFNHKARDMERKFEHEGERKLSDKEEKLGQMFLDTLVGDMKNQFVQNGESISVELEGAQIPEVAQLMLDVALEGKETGEEHREGRRGRSHCEGKNNGECEEYIKEIEDFMSFPEHVELPKLKEADLTAISLEAQVVDGLITQNTLNIKVTGKDEAGETQELVLNMALGIKDLNNTTVELLDVQGKTVKDIEVE